jgi:hypothetical protein
LHGWNDPILDEPGYECECDVEVELYYYDSITWVGESIDIECGYIGFIYLGDCDPWGPTWAKVTLSDGGVAVDYGSIVGGAINWISCVSASVSESCDPYYGDTGVIVTGITDCCWVCPDCIIQRWQITITE